MEVKDLPVSTPSFPAFNSSFKDVQNFLVGENLIRKAAQLRNDLALIRERDANPEAFIERTQSSTNTLFEERIEKSIQDIIDIRTRLGITEPQGRHTKPLEELLNPSKGSVINSLL